MDPNLFHLDWERTLEALVGIIVLSFVVERACALLFESRWWISRFEDARVGKLPGGAENPPTGETTKPVEQKVLAAQRYPLKEFIVLVLSLVICWVWKFDAVSIIMLSESTQLAGIIVTAAVVAGGSKASIALFHDLLKVRSSANEQKKNLQK
ncbi:MAG: hypothetical protein ACYS17_14540 [Planctomycetota bacterium]|jgi:hypothetical protein